jgi:hypothetical protein
MPLIPPVLGWQAIRHRQCRRPVEASAGSDIVPEVRKVLEHCIHAGQDLLLPSLGDIERVETFFLIACTDANGFSVMAERIRRGLQNFDSASILQPVISSTTLSVALGPSKEEQIREVMERIEQLIDEHLTHNKKPQWPEKQF